MTRDEAKFILVAARHRDPEREPDPELAEALRLAQQDEELGAWLRAELAMDQVVRQRLATVSPPSELRAAILAGRRLEAVRPVSWFGRHQSWLAAAAAVIFLALGGYAWFARGDSPTRGLRREVATYLEDRWDHGFDLRNRQFANLQDWLKAQGAPAFEVSATLASSPTFGCRVFEWRGSKAYLVCFSPRGLSDIVHVVSVPRSAVGDARVGSPPEFRTERGWQTATWSHGDRVYVALALVSREALAGLL